MFDEVYVFQKLQYSVGKFTGLTEDGVTPATTVLVSMIKSQCSKYCDVVSMKPLTKMNVDILKKEFSVTLRVVEDAGFQVIAAIADNHPVNRAFFKDFLGGGRLQSHVPHPFNY